jgi:hypothetical protein
MTTISSATPVYHLVVDAGNGNTKAALVKGSTVVLTTVFPSLLRFTSDSLFVFGGFTFAGTSCVVGADCEDRDDTLVVGDDNQGKIKYLPQLLAGVVSNFNPSIPVGAVVHVHLLTLSFDRRPEIEAAVAQLADLSIDGVPKQLVPVLAELLPEGVGCSSYAAAHFGKPARQLSVLDVGSGTMNLSTYNVENSSQRSGSLGQTFLPRRTSFRFEGVGVATLTKFAVAAIKDTTTNGQVDKRLVQQAIESNTLRLLDTFDGTCIKEAFTKAIEQWLRLTEVKALLTKVIYTLQTGGYVSTCGGGFKLALLKEAIETSILTNVTEEAATRWLVPDEVQVLGVIGYAKVLANANRREQKLASEQRSGKPKSRKKAKTQQHSESSPESVDGVSSLSNSEQNALGGTNSPGVEGVASGAEQQVNPETVGA